MSGILDTHAVTGDTAGFCGAPRRRLKTSEQAFHYVCYVAEGQLASKAGLGSEARDVR